MTRKHRLRVLTSYETKKKRLYTFLFLGGVFCVGSVIIYQGLARLFQEAHAYIFLVPVGLYMTILILLAVYSMTKTGKRKRYLRIASERLGLLSKDTDDKHITQSVKWAFWHSADTEQIEFYPQGRGLSDEQIETMAKQLSELLEDLSGQDWIFKNWRPDKRKGVIFIFSHNEDERLKFGELSDYENTNH